MALKKTNKQTNKITKQIDIIEEKKHPNYLTQPSTIAAIVLFLAYLVY